MNDGFVRAAAATPNIEVADPLLNSLEIERLMREADARETKVMVFPELCLTGYTCGDLFLQDSLLFAARERLAYLVKVSESLDGIYFVGLPWLEKDMLYNCMAAISHGRLLGLVTKMNMPNYTVFYEQRHFNVGMKKPIMTNFLDINGETYQVPLGSDILFNCENLPGLIVSAEICEDLWVPDNPSIHHCLNGATVIVNASASDEAIDKDIYRKSLIKGQSGRLFCAYVYASAGEGESTTDLVYSGHNIIAENGSLLAESRRFINETIYADIDLGKVGAERKKRNTFVSRFDDTYMTVPFTVDRKKNLSLQRHISPTPFIPENEQQRDKHCEDILAIQTSGLKKRLLHTHCTHAVIGLSGGLDSTLALIVTVETFDQLSIPRQQIQAVTMPCFGTTDRTYQNACQMAKTFGVTLIEIDIKEAVLQHFKDIGHDANVRDVTYENAQARERTQVLMDMANQVNGLVIGTGDMSELALGWATYNGDHMSMYGVNASVPKTMVRYLVGYYTSKCQDFLKSILLDVLDTPVSPELLPPEEDGQIKQKTEDIVGPYELHDFYLYYILRFGYSPKKVYRMAVHAFEGQYSNKIIYKWLYNFYRRFFSQQFKRSCLPDGPRVGSVSLSPRGDLRMPSDASVSLWKRELEEIIVEE